MPPSRIGRYRIVRPLGSGGMGEVYEALDEQLQRPVAIKGLPQEASTPERRARLHREALSAAALSHPAIAHVYEIVTDDDRDWLVMEYVAGSSLAQVLEGGPLPPAEVARIGDQVARALAAAHEKGIIHRDIKTENVMVTPAGDVKVLDFGLAKWTGVRAPSDDRLTHEGFVVGTSRAMSPEQALGREVDERSDIFSLGSLLYEMASGKAAFRGATPAETMVKVARAEHTSIAEVAPGLPAALAQVVERCLARDPGGRFPSALAAAELLRPLAQVSTDPTAVLAQLSGDLARRSRRTLWAGLGAVALLTALAVVTVQRGWLAARPPLVVAVLPVSVEGGPEIGRLPAAAIADAIVSHLAGLKDVQVVSGREVRAVATEGKRASEIARELGAGELVETSLTLGATSHEGRVELARVDGATGRVTWSTQLDLATDDLLLIEDRATTVLTDAYRGFAVAPQELARQVTPEALAAYLDARARLDAGQASKGYQEEIALLQRASAAAPRFLEPLVDLASIYRYLYGINGDAEGLARCQELVKRAVQLAPGNPKVLDLQVEMALALGDSQAALETARAWTSSRPGDNVAWSDLATALGKLNRFPEAEAAYARSLALRPGWQTFFFLASLRSAHGDWDGARQAARELLARAPDNLFAISQLAEIEMYSGNHAASEKLYRELLAKRGGRFDRIHLGNCLFYQGRFAEAAALYREAVEADRSDFLALANLGDAQVATGDPAAARESYRHALELCEADYARGARDRWLLETRARCLAQLGRGPEATLAIQEALKSYPENPATLFMAALVAALTGDENACIAWTTQALNAHAPAVWFTTPEFARMRGRADFPALVSAAR